jgi:hypothetical protein
MRTERTSRESAHGRPTIQLVQSPEPERHEGAITEPIEGEPLSESDSQATPPPEPVASRATEESESHEGTITEPEEDQVPDDRSSG